MTIQGKFLLISAVVFVGAAIWVWRQAAPKPSGVSLESAAPNDQLNGFQAEV